jgi:hypothetical protein
MWMKLFRLPREFFKHAGNTVRQNYIYEQSHTRFENREDAYIWTGPLVPEIGRYDDVRFIESSEY